MNYTELSSGKTSSKRDRVTQALRNIGFNETYPGDDVVQYDIPVVLFWSKDFEIRDAAEWERLKETARSGRLISVLLEKTALPDDLPKHPFVDLINWRGSQRNAFFQDLRRYLEAAHRKAPPPSPKGPFVRLVKRMCAGLTVGMVAAFVFAVGLNLLELQNNLCSINFSQPGLSDFCGKWGLGDKPTVEERVAWETRDPTSCDALRTHIERFGEGGALHGLAADMLDARRILIEEEWVDDKQISIFSQTITAEGRPSVEDAQKNALIEGQKLAEASCRTLAATDFYRFLGADLTVKEWECSEFSSGHYCGFDGEKTCSMKRLIRTSTEVCGPDGS